MAASIGGALGEQTWKRINSQQKHAPRIIFNKSKFEHTSELLKSSKILNEQKLNIFNMQFLYIKLKENPHQAYFFQNSENPLIFTSKLYKTYS